jgi:hypothetical protein
VTGSAPGDPEGAQPRGLPRWVAAPLALLTLGLGVVTWGAVRAVADDPSFVQVLRLVIEAIATGFLAWSTVTVARRRG